MGAAGSCWQRRVDVKAILSTTGTIVLLAALAVGSGLGTAAQGQTTPTAASLPTPTPAPGDAGAPFQTVRVGEFAYALDPFFPCVAVITSRVIKLATDEDN